MSCEEDTTPVQVDAIMALFEAIDDVGTGRLHAIERDILDGLRARPFGTWCRAQLGMLVALHAKAHGALTGSRDRR